MLHSFMLRPVLGAAFSLFIVARLQAAPSTPIAFARDIQPLLQKNCVSCHGPEKQKGGLRLDDKAAAFKGGDSGERGIVPGHAGQSRLLHLVSSSKPEERMPPQGPPLSAKQIDLLKRWIDSGAQWPEAKSAQAAIQATQPTSDGMKVTDSDRQHWSFRPLQKAAPPIVKDKAWARTPIDQFVRRAQETKGLSPAPPAEARTLVRRLYFDLIGLPPAPAEMQHWSVEITKSRTAVSVLIEELLARPQYGERWARHWLDVARYADSNGQEGDGDRPNAYHFRDFVIRALNDDLPYDTFVRWQLAGDEIAPENPQAIAATGFIVAGNSTILNVPMEEEKLRNRANELDDMVSTTGQAMLGLTLACARCHDHKYDPLPTRDYYRLMRVFNSGDRTEVPLGSPSQVKAQREAESKWKAESDSATKERDEWFKKAREPLAEQVRAAKIARLPLSDDEKRLLREKPNDAEAKKLAERFQKELKIEDADYLTTFSPEQKARWDELEARIKTVAARKPAALSTAFAFADFAPEPRESWLFERGDFMARKEKMDLGFLTVLTKGKTAADYWKDAQAAKLRDDSTQQRRALANWMTDVDNGAGTLLARVMVNRIWQHHFGEGLVRTVSDFGTRGEVPTHPQLLEWLTGEFMRSGWKLKHLHRLILNSSTYGQSTAFDKKKNTLDPENRLLWRRRPQRIESEALRDSMLAVAGTLNPAMFGPSFKPPIPAEALQARNVKDPYPRDAKDTPSTRRRTVYMFHKRVVQYPLMQAFDAPDAQTSCSRRMNTTVAPQALALLNDPFVRLRAEELARRLQTESKEETEEKIKAQVQLAFQLCLSRPPSPEELNHSLAFITAQVAVRQKRDARLSLDVAQHLALTDFCQSLFGLNEFIYID